MRMCDIVLDPSFGHIDFSQDFSNKTIFVNTDYFEQVLPKLTQSSNIFLVVHHSDRFFDRIMFEAVRKCTRKIFARNCDFIHPHIVQIPIGFVDAPPFPGQFMTRTRVDEKLLKSIRDANVQKDIETYVNVNLHGSETKFASVRALRQACLDAFSNDTERRPFPEFMKMLRRSKYVVCPMGFGIDTHRFFEAAYMKARPVVISSNLDPLYKKFGAVILDSWDDPLPDVWEEPNVPEEYFHTDFWLKFK